MTSRLRRIGVLVLLPLVGLSAGSSAQVPGPASLKPATATLPEPFSFVVAVRELSDGRVLIGDRIEVRVVVANFATGTVRQVGRRGQGPEEFSAVRYLHPLAGDTTLLVDRTARRWHLLHADQIVRPIPPDHPAFLATNGLVYGADARGALLAHADVPFERMNPAATRLDSTILLRVAFATGVTDTMARHAPHNARIEIGGTPDRRSIGIYSQFLDAAEDALLFADGWLAIARLNPYRVDWRSPDGSWTRGAPLPFQAIRVTDREKDVYLYRREVATGRTIVARPETRWPATIPPFEGSPIQDTPLLALPDGRLLIARTPSADHPETRYDVVDRRGRLVMQLTMLESERIVGAGRRGLYVAALSDDGLERVRRHPLP